MVSRKAHLAHSFLPAASPKALTRISREFRHWALHHRSDKSLSDLAAMYNPSIRGWINYYSHFYPTQLRPTLKGIDAYVIRWARRKYKRMVHRTKGARDWFDRLRRANPHSLPIGHYAMATAEHREPYESRGSRTVLGAPEGESPSGNSSKCEILIPRVDVSASSPNSDIARRGRHFAFVPHPDACAAAVTAHAATKSGGCRAPRQHGCTASNLDLHQYCPTTFADRSTNLLKPNRSSDMRKQLLVAVGCLISSIASAQEWRPVAEKWRACADAQRTVRKKYRKCSGVGTVTTVLRRREKATMEAVKQVESASFAEDYIETLERRYIDVLAVRVVEMRLR